MIDAGSGEIYWNSSLLQQTESKSDKQTADSEADIHGIFYRALENLIDKALMQLSIVRFGFQQWIGIEQKSDTAAESSGSTFSTDSTLLDEWELPLTPKSPETGLLSGEESFLPDSTTQKDSKKVEESISLTSGNKHEAEETSHVYTLRITIGASQQGLLLQHNSRRVSSLRPIDNMDAVFSQGVCATRKGKEQDNNVNGLPPMAAAKIAPYGVAAKIISIPAMHLGNVEQESIDAWASIFGYPVSFLTEAKIPKQSKESSLIWITMAGTDEPMLYPRRLVFLDTEETTAMFASTPNELDTPATATMQEDTKVTASAGHETKLREDSVTDATQMSPADEHEEREDGEEGEEGEEGEYDEEGEISDSADTTLQYSAIPASAELDSIISQLSTQTSRSLEQSLPVIRNTMTLFQTELQAEEEKEKENRAKEEAVARIKEKIPPIDGTTATTSTKTTTNSNGARKRQRSSSKGEGSNKARRKSNATTAPATATETRDSKLDISTDDIPLQALLTGTTAQQPKSESAGFIPTAAGMDEGKSDGASGTDADFEGLFGDVGIDVGGIGLMENGEARSGDTVTDGQGDIGLGFGQMNDDMGLGMDMSIGDNLDGGMGDLTSMFGVTDDDFNFFDSMPSAPPPQQQQTKAVSLAAPLPTVTKQSTGVGIKSDLVFENALGLGETGRRDATSVSAFATRDMDHQNTDAMDDMFDDDGMFDSFFGHTTTTAGDSVSAAELDEAFPEPSQTADDTDMHMVITTSVDDSISVIASTGLKSADSEQSMDIHALSSPPGVASVLSTTETHVGVPETLGSSMITDLATPASIRATPGQCTDILTPTPTSNPTQLTKGVTAAGDDISAHGVTVPIPEVLHAQGDDGAGAEVSTVQRCTEDATAQKASAHAQKTRAAAMRPKTYSSVSTAFDDVGKDSRSWLRDRPTPAQINDDSMDLQDEVVHRHHCVSLIERSLNPVSWIKRVSARQLQHQAMAGRGGSEGCATSVPRSVRRMRNWLASYQAKLSYTKDYAPRSVRKARASAANGAAAAEAEANLEVAKQQDGLSQALPQPQHKESLTTTTQGRTGQNLQYPQLGGMRMTERATDARQPSFISIISPRKTLAQRQQPGGGVQMPGSLAPSLDIGSLRLATSSSLEVCHPAPPVVCATALAGSWVPLWLCVAGGAVELLVDQPLAVGRMWDAAFSKLAGAARQSLVAAGSSYTYQAEITPAHADRAQADDSVTVNNLGARIGGLLLGPQRVQGSSADEGGRVHTSQHAPESFSEESREGLALSNWISQLREDSDRWTAIVEMLADWAVHGTLLACLQGCVSCDEDSDEPCKDRHDSLKGQTTVTLLGPQKLTMVLESFWLGTHNMCRAEEGKRGRTARDDAEQPDISGTLTLGRLVGLDNTSPAATAKYRGYVVKKRRVGPSSSSGCADNGGAVVVPSGVGTIEPLLDTHILVGTYGQEDVALALSGGGMLRRRDAESIYVKRWRYTQTLATRATHEARAAAGETEEAEEGEEREDGSTAEDQNKAVEEWPDPDGPAMEAEDALRRVCMAASPLALRWWTQMHMRPVGASKDVQWVMFVPPDNDSAGESANKWSRADSRAAEWYLRDVDSAYQAAHFGTHRPLEPRRALDSVSPQQPVGAKLPTPPEQWSARLRYDAELLGRSTAHAWHAAAESQSTAATTIVAYVLVPYAHNAAPWVALADAAAAVVQAFERTLRGMRSRGPWPALVIHPLSLDALRATQCGRRPSTAQLPSPWATAAAVYNRCPAFLTHVSPDSAPNAMRSREIFARRSGYFVRRSTTQQSGLEPVFAHRAFIISMPCQFPTPSSSVAPATMALSAARCRSDFVTDAAAANLPVVAPPSAYPAPFSPAAAPPIVQPSPGAAELDEVRVAFTRSAAEPFAAQLVAHPLHGADAISTLHCVYCVVRPARGSAWIAVCWCDERAEYVEHEAFPVAVGTAATVGPATTARIWRGCLRYQTLFGGGLRVVLAEWQGMSLPQARAWRDHVADWRLHAQPPSPVILHVANIGANPSTGLRLSRPSLSYTSTQFSTAVVVEPATPSGPAVSEEAAQQQWSLVLQGRQPHMVFASPDAQTACKISEAQPITAAPACLRQSWPTAYLVLQDRRACTPSIPCFCLQLLDVPASDEALRPAFEENTLCRSSSSSSSSFATDVSSKDELMITRAILSQYHQLACLRRAELDAAAPLTRLRTSHVCEWPVHLLPLPIAIVEDMRRILELLTAY
ncbi:hypothetical protein H4S08_000191 [Coemansia sp. RSA 1365]|nr:hypothetical protein H4S08_000191 [Coemansia sp. RSA 1365]